MNKKYFIVLLLAISFIVTSLFSQNSDAQLALKYYKDKEFDKAGTIYIKLYEETGYKTNRDYYLKCLFENKDFDIAEKFLKKQIRKNKSDFYLNIDLGMTYFYSNRFSEAEKEFGKVIERVRRNRNNTYSAAAAFINYRQYSFAEQAYKSGEDFLRTDFSMELGNLYYIQRDYERMMISYLKYLASNPQAMPTIQSRLQYVMSKGIDDSISEIVERLVLEKIQEFPQNQTFNDLLIWHYTQLGKYRVALNQLYSIDKRTKSGEYDILEYGILLFNNKQNDLALEAFDYLMQKGTDNNIYNSAYIEYLNVLYTKTTSNISPDQSDLIHLEQMLTESLEFVLRKESYKVIYALVNIKAFYLEKYEESISLINTSISEKRFRFEEEQVLKLLLGDIYFLNDNPWDAILVYAQVEKSLTESPIGHEARFKKAQLAYYTGQFKWAQAQLDVLKASTSKLIANNAMELSMFIAENYNLDTTETTMQIFARADFYIFSKQYNLAFQSLDSITELYPSHTLIDDVLFKKGMIYEATNNYEKASEYYNIIAEDYYYEILADNALYRYALMQEKLNNYEIAKESYFKLITDFPGSIYTVDARKSLRSLSKTE